MDNAIHLRERAQNAGAQFLLGEPQTALALLDTAAASEDPEANERRRALAVEAVQVVTDWLARTGQQAVELNPRSAPRLPGFARSSAAGWEVGQRLRAGASTPNSRSSRRFPERTS